MHVSLLRPLSGCLLTVAAIFAASLPIVAQSEGTLDLSFNSTGYRYEDFGGGSNEGLAVAVQPDGKIVVAGRADGISGSGTDFAIVRYNSGGSLDTSFGTGGKVTTAIGPGTSQDIAYAVAIQADGKIVAAGQAEVSGAGTDFGIVRYNADGSLDTSFGTGGKVTTAFGTATSGDIANAVAIQPDGKIIAAGFADDVAGSGADFALARYNADGSLDASFGVGGKTTTPVNAGTLGDFAQAVVIQPNGMIVAAGWTEDASGLSVDFALVRYNSNGSLDLTFDGDGKVITSIGSSTTLAFAASVAIQADGKIVAAGLADDESLGADFALVRYNTDGSPDASFDSDGIVTTAIVPGAHGDFAQSIVIQPDGKIVAAGFTDDVSGGPGTDLAIVRYNTNGSLDSSFNTDGISTIDLGGTEFIRAAAIYSGNRIAVAGGGGSTFLTARIWLTTLLTAADVTVSGRVTDAYGRSIKRATLSLTDEKGVTRTAVSNTFGYYRFDQVKSGSAYVLQVAAARYTFADPVRLIDAGSDVQGMDFVAENLRRLPNSKGNVVTKVKLTPEFR